jgi:Protein of unknown function (DUF2442)
MLHNVTAATHKGGYLIEIEFEDGSRGVVDFSKYETRGGVFSRFKDPAYFQRFRVDEDAGTLIWDDNVDIAPETLYAQATGKLPSWMEPEEADATNAFRTRTMANAQEENLHQPERGR